MSDLIHIAQGSAEWFAARIGHLTSSRIADATAKRKRRGNGKEITDDLQCRIDLRLELAVERVTQKISEHYVSYWMSRGLEMEPAARFTYEQRTEMETQQVGFVLHPSIHWAGASPDGLVGDEGMVEFKVPKPQTHAEYLLAECVPEIYQPQICWQMACTGRKWCDFVSWCDDFPAPLDLLVVRLPRDEERIKQMEAEARKFLAEVEATVTQLRGGLEAVLRESIDSGVPRAVIPALDV